MNKKQKIILNKVEKIMKHGRNQEERLKKFYSYLKKQKENKDIITIGFMIEYIFTKIEYDLNLINWNDKSSNIYKKLLLIIKNF